MTVFVITAVLAAAVAAWFIWPGWVSSLFLAVAVALWLLILYFFRDPNRPLPQDEKVVVSPADGTVVAIAEEVEHRTLRQATRRLSIFLAVTNVHIQRAPVSGEVALVERRPGKFLQAFRPEASEVNESIAMVIRSAHGAVLVRQIAGILARRCVNHARPGDRLRAGQRFGLIKFGSRVDLYLPLSTHILVAIGDKVVGGVTEVARFAPVGTARVEPADALPLPSADGKGVILRGRP